MHQTWTTHSKELGDTIRLEFALGQAMLNTGQVRDGICACVWRYLGAHLCRPNSSVTQLTKPIQIPTKATTTGVASVAMNFAISKLFHMRRVSVEREAMVVIPHFSQPWILFDARCDLLRTIPSFVAIAPRVGGRKVAPSRRRLGGGTPPIPPCDLPPNLMRCAGQPPASALKGKEFPAETRTSARTPRNCSTSELPSGTSYVGRSPRYLTAHLTVAERELRWEFYKYEKARPTPPRRQHGTGPSTKLRPNQLPRNLIDQCLRAGRIPGSSDDCSGNRTSRCWPTC